MQSTVQAEYKIGKAIVRMHGTPDRERLEKATAKFMWAVIKKQKEQEKQGGECR